jgi:hypothetical protein
MSKPVVQAQTIDINYLFMINGKIGATAPAR